MEFKFTKQVTDLLIQGGTIVKTMQEDEKLESLFTGLIRMPKGKFIKDDRYEDNYFEYVIIQNSKEYSSDRLNPISVIQYGNDHLATMKVRVRKEHSKDLNYIYNRRWRREEEAKKAVA